MKSNSVGMLLKAHGRDRMARINGSLGPLDSWVLADAYKAKPPLWVYSMYVDDIFPRGLHCISLCLLRAEHVPFICYY
jgi:hypothetical protein